MDSFQIESVYYYILIRLPFYLSPNSLFLVAKYMKDLTVHNLYLIRILFFEML